MIIHITQNAFFEFLTTGGDIEYENTLESLYYHQYSGTTVHIVGTNLLIYLQTISVIFSQDVY